MTGVDYSVESDAMAILSVTGAAGYVPDLPEDKVLRFVAALAIARLVHADLVRRYASGMASATWNERAVEANLDCFLSQASAILGDVRHRLVFGAATAGGLDRDRRDAILGPNAARGMPVAAPQARITA